jgi:hypothetical protein
MSKSAGVAAESAWHSDRAEQELAVPTLAPLARPLILFLLPPAHEFAFIPDSSHAHVFL